MSLRVRLILLWALSSLLVIFLLFITGFLIFRRFSPTDQEMLIEVLFPFRFHLLLPLVFLVLALIWGAKWFLEKYWFPLERMLEELELVRTVNSSLRIQTQGSTQLKALAAKLNQMASNTELTQQEIKKKIEQATRSRFYLMPWLLGYTVMGMLSFPLESEIAGLIYRILSPQ